MKMELGIKNILLSVINCFETGRPDGDYGNVSVYMDGKTSSGRPCWQVTYGRSQTTEQGKLKILLESYIENEGEFSGRLKGIMRQINQIQNNGVTIATWWAESRSVKELLQEMGKDPIMRKTQDEFFDREYFQPAMKWAETNGFDLPLSRLVIYDSFIHSGQILDFLRQRFAEVPPAKGGNEAKWIKQYLETRHKWLKNHENPALRISSNRVWVLLQQVKKGNWLLSQNITANGHKIDGYNG